MNLFWINDPSTKQPSVSLTLLLVAFLGTVVAGSLQLAGLVTSSSIFLELTLTFVALYFGRRLNIGGKQFTSEKAEEIVNKVENK